MFAEVGFAGHRPALQLSREGPDKRVAPPRAGPDRIQALARKGIDDGNGRGCAADLGERRVVNELVAAKVIVVADGPCLEPRQASCLEAHDGVAVVRFHADGRGVHAHDVREQRSGHRLRERRQRGALAVV